MSIKSGSASRACFSLRSPCSRATKRSSLHHTCTRDQSIRSRRGWRAAAARTAEPMEPPVSETCRGRPSDRPLPSRWTNRVATASARAEGSALITTRFSMLKSAMRLLRRGFQELPALGDHSTIQDVRIEATELLRQALAKGAAGQDEVVLGLAG